ncbi:MAG: hypothetical protein LW821_07345 [Flammeovirgaceae bacterium]|jgi:hypothetical protein|nr:hypothetical protein [Flammeovirgaceae bacterium]
MKATSQNQQNLPLRQHQHADVKLLNNTFLFASKIIQASLLTCFFYCASFAQTQQDADMAYEQVMQLQFLKHPKALKSSIEIDYALELSHVLEVLAEEDDKLYQAYEEQFETTVASWKKKRENEPYLAELYVLWAFAKLKMKQEFQAAMLIRKAYHIVTDEHHNKNLKAQKTKGLLYIMLGAVPEKYNWLLRVFSMQGNTTEGIQLLKNLYQAEHNQAWESGLWLALAQGYLLQEPQLGLALADSLIQQKPNRTIAKLLAASLALKANQAEITLGYINNWQTNKNTTPLVYYLAGEANLCKGNDVEAAAWFIRFHQQYKGTNLVKDAYFKTGLSYWLLNQNSIAKRYFTLAAENGVAHTEADKYAEKALSTIQESDKTLWRIRLFTDGGYFTKAKELVESKNENDFIALKNQVEFYYRKARLFDKLKEPISAEKFYLQTITKAGKNSWYFAPNACLQLGYHYKSMNQIEKACLYFNQALSYDKHEYKNSIDSKAKAALAQLNCK